MTELKAYKIPDDIIKFGDYFEIEGLGIGFKINSHSDDFEKGQAILTKNLFTYVFSGKKEILHSNGKVVVRKNESAILKQGSYVVSERYDTDEVFKNLLFFFSDNFIEKIKIKEQKLSKENKHFFHKIQTNNILNELTLSIENYLSSNFEKIDKNEILSIKANELVHVLKAIVPEIKSFLSSISYENQNNLIGIFEKHYKENLQLSDYVHLTGLSISSLKRKFKQEINTSPKKWITERRLVDAEELLIDKKMNISEIAYDLGFDSPSHFSRTFNEKYGKSPSKYRSELYG